ncbi:unnamed protein product [Auanema sp. JU1783]|nr:unnamed protein product [Auanema sp. JU1783]
MASIDVAEILRSSKTEEQPPVKRSRVDESAFGKNASLSNPEAILAALENDNTQGIVVNEVYVKKIISSLEKKMLRNREMRIKYPDDPKKFMESEIELDNAIQEMHSLATQPDLYGCFVETGGPSIMLSLLAHENSDIVGATVNLLQELTDGDILNEGEDGAAELIESLAKGRIIESFTTSFERLNESNKDDGDAIHNALSVVENMIDFRQETTEECVNQGLFNWVLKRACRKDSFDANQAYASEILALLLQISDQAKKKLTENVDGIDMLLRALAVYKRIDPVHLDEREYMENLFNALCSALMLAENRKKFLEGEGLQLMNLMLREKKQSRESALKVLDHATTGPDGVDNCNYFVEILGLRTLFPLFMRTPAQGKRKDTSADEHEEHVCAILTSLMRSCEENARQRIIQKFSEHEHEKVDRAVELFQKYRAKVSKFERKQSSNQDSEDEDVDRKYLDKLDAGLYTLQNIALILLDVCVSSPSACYRTQKLFNMKLKVDRLSKVLLPVVVEYQSNLGDDAVGEKQRVDNLVSRLTEIESMRSIRFPNEANQIAGSNSFIPPMEGNLTQPLEQELVDFDQSTSSRPYARLLSLNSVVDSCDLFDELNVCGRGTDNVNLRLTRIVKNRSHTYISNRHFELRRDKPNHASFIKDISTNGTFKNKEKLEKGKEYSIVSGDVISLGYPDFLIFLYDEHMLNNCPPELESQYIITNVCLGTGSYGQVLLARLRADLTQNYAIKIIEKKRKKNNEIVINTEINNEISILIHLNHPNIIRLHGYVDNDVTSHIVLEYIGGGDFFSFIINPKWKNRGIGDTLGKYYAYQFLSALEYLHDKGISHRDIKPENILMVSQDDFTVAKLADFGLSKPQDAATMKTFCGTVGYIAPEVIAGDGTPYSNKVDLFSLGVVLFTAVSGYPPFSDYGDDISVTDQIKSGHLRFFRVWKRISMETQNAIKKMLLVEEARRPSATSLLEEQWMKTKPALISKKTVEEYVAGKLKFSADSM